MEETQSTPQCGSEEQFSDYIRKRDWMSMTIDYKKCTKNVLCIFSAILGIGILSVVIAFMAVLGGIVCILYILKSLCECIVHDVTIILSYLFSSCMLDENNPTDDSGSATTPCCAMAPLHPLNAEHFIVEINVADIEKDKEDTDNKLPVAVAVAVNHQKIIPYTGV